MSDTLMTIPLSKLRRSSQNVRKTDAATDLGELTASIAAVGVLQNLTVRSAPKTGKKKAAFEVVAGGRRLAALKLLARKKRIAGNYPVPCRVLSDDDATEVSLAENIVRAPLHPADQYEAFSKLHKQGLVVEEIATRFGVALTVVRQRLKLAAVSPRLMEIYRTGDMTLDQLIAFTITEDHEAQEHVWFDGPNYDRHPHAIRRTLTRTLVEGSDRRARYIGAEAYEAAGGAIIRDLFSPDDEGYFADSELLGRLAREKLTAEAEKIKAEGWSWVEVRPELDHGYLATFRHIPPTEAPLAKKQEAKLKKLCDRHDTLVTELEDDAPPDTIAELDRISAEIDTLSERKQQWSDEEKGTAGVLVSLDYHGDLSVTRGLAQVERRKRGASTGNGGAAQHARARNVLSDSVLEDLSAHRTAALREVLAGRPDVALTGLLHTLVMRIFFCTTVELSVDVCPRTVGLTSSAESIGESKAVVAMASRHKSWSEQLPDWDKLWSWLSGQSDEARHELLAYCVATAVNAVRRRNDGDTEMRMDQATLLATATELDMAEWWEPTKDRYLGRVSKASISSAVAEAVSPQAAENILGMKKDAMVVRAEELLTGTRWLPEPLRCPTELDKATA